jgi:beta-phosphoglucomutase-like phosphatase (HAD superfamily)
VTTLPGVDSLLKTLQSHRCSIAVVTHSKQEHVLAIRHHAPLLNMIPTWITREDYLNPKPAPDGYLHALKTLQSRRAIGFEDSKRGFMSLLAARELVLPTQTLLPVWVHPELQDAAPHLHLKSFEEIHDRMDQYLKRSCP